MCKKMKKVLFTNPVTVNVCCYFSYSLHRQQYGELELYYVHIYHVTVLILIQKQPSCKQKCVACKKAIGKKDVYNPKVAANEWLWR